MRIEIGNIDLSAFTPEQITARMSQYDNYIVSWSYGGGTFTIEVDDSIIERTIRNKIKALMSKVHGHFPDAKLERVTLDREEEGEIEWVSKAL